MTMKRITPSTVFLSLVLFFVTAVCLFGAEPSQPSGSGSAGFLQSHAAKLWIPLAVPSLLAALKLVWPTVPKALLPYLCPLLGAGLSFIGPVLNQDIDPGLAAALGAAGNWLRETYDQSRKAMDGHFARPVQYVFALICLAPAMATAAPTPAPAIGNGQSEIGKSFLSFSRLSLTPFASYRVNEWGSRNGKFGGGLAVGYALHKHVTIEAEAIAERFDDSHWGDSFTEAGANIKFPLLPGRLVNPYGLLGYTRNLDEDENRMNAGAGLEVSLGKHAAAFADGRWTHNFSELGHALFRAGLTLRF